MDWLGEGCHDFGSLSGCESRSDLTFVLPWLPREQTSLAA